jgi:poly-gamma-glutamate capsule biosynthesis protein CapA/YwtB (metallophosphatase superfamily)
MKRSNVSSTAAATAAALVVALAPVAHADNADNYIAALASQGVTGDRAALIGAADDLCNAAAAQNAGGIWPGISPNIAAAMRVQAGLNAQGLSNDQVGIVIRTARNVYCPQNGRV